VKRNRIVVGIVTGATVVSGNAMAALPTEATAAMADLVTDAGTMIGLAWGLAAVTVAGAVVIMLFKKFSSKGA
jgi:hypothetical protein